MPPSTIADETIRQADRITLRIALDSWGRPPADVLAAVEDWSPHDWNVVAARADQPRPTSAVQAVVLATIRRAVAAERTVAVTA